MSDVETRSAARFAAVAAGAMPPDDGPLRRLAETAFLFAGGRPPSRPIGIAVSGGSDSMATLSLISAVHPVEAVTVNHGLRPEAATEAAFVARFCADRGIPHTTLHWDGTQATGNLMDAARRARLRLIGDWARGRGIGQVALGHTADDQAETFLMRLARASGTEGLAGMRPDFEAEGVVWHRPFLGHSRADLRAHLTRAGIGWIEDPSNLDDRFDRVKARKALKVLDPLGIGVETLNAVAQNIAMTEGAVGVGLSLLIRAHVRVISGDVVISARGFDHEFGPEIQRRVINAALLWVSGADYAPRAAKVADVLASWRERRDRTLHGCRITLSDTELRITREARAVAGLQVPFGQPWDRWRIEGPTAPELTLAALGAGGLAQARDWRESGLPRPTLLASPAVWAGDRLVSAPLAGLKNGYEAHLLRPSFTSAPIRR